MLKPVRFLVPLVLLGGCSRIPLIYWLETRFERHLLNFRAGGFLLQTQSRCPLLWCWQLLHSQFNREASLFSSRNPLSQITPLRPPTSCASHVALEIGCNVIKQMGSCVQRSLLRNAAFPNCNWDCRSQLLPPCSGYQPSSETCYLRLRRKGFIYMYISL